MSAAAYGKCPLTGMYCTELVLELKQGFVKACVSRSVRSRECPRESFHSAFEQGDAQYVSQRGIRTRHLKTHKELTARSVKKTDTES